MDEYDIQHIKDQQTFKVLRFIRENKISQIPRHHSGWYDKRKYKPIIIRDKELLKMINESK